MASASLCSKAVGYLQRLCLDLPSRSTGSSGNRAATDFFEYTVASFGFKTQTPTFDCLDWCQAGARLCVSDKAFEVQVSPYSLGCQVRAPLVVASTLEELQRVEAANSILLLQGGLANEPLMPKNFPFYNPEEHKHIIGLLEAKRPEAIIAATGQHPEAAGALSPFPLIEDGDFDIPSVYMTEEEGTRLLAHASTPLELDIQAKRTPATGCNVIARKGTARGARVVLLAHIDAKAGTPGALDNAAGVVTLLLLAELLKNYGGKLELEVVAMNGEDHYANPGEMLYLSCNEGSFDTILLGINLDGLGYHEGHTAYSLYGCPAEMATLVQNTLSPHSLVLGEAWYQGDHGLFLIKQRPALALTSERALELLRSVIHTPNDQPDIIDTTKLVTAALALRELCLRLGKVSN